MRIALVENGIVVNVIEAAPDWSPPAGIQAVQHDSASIGWVMSGGALTAPEIQPTAEMLLAHAALRRRQVADAGTTVTVGGVAIPVWTDPDSRAALTSLVVAASLDSAFQTAWKGRDGVFYPVNGDGVRTLAAAVLAHVQAAFSAESRARASVDAGTATTIDAVNAFFGSA